jgi:hypothetical protein
MILKPTNESKCTKMYYTHCVPPTCFAATHVITFMGEHYKDYIYIYISILHILIETMHGHKILNFKKCVV